MLLTKAFASLLCIDPNTSALPVFLLVPCSPAKTQTACCPHGLCQPSPKPLVALHTSIETSAFCFPHPGLSLITQFLMLPSPSNPSLPELLKLEAVSSPHTHIQVYNLPLSRLFAIPENEILPVAPVPPCWYLRSM